MSGYELIPLAAPAVDLFPADIKPVILKNIHYGQGMYEAAMLFNSAGNLIGAGGVRRNEEGLWVAWLWTAIREEIDRLALLRNARRWLRDWQYEHGYPVHGVISVHNRTGERLAKWMRFQREAKCTYYRKPENDFEIWTREVIYASGSGRTNGTIGVGGGIGAGAKCTGNGASGSAGGDQ